MPQPGAQLSTGLAGLDRVLKGLIAGDNVVWQVDSTGDFLPFVKPYCDAALRSGQRLVYFRFARHRALVETNDGAEVHELDPDQTWTCGRCLLFLCGHSPDSMRTDCHDHAVPEERQT